MATNDPAPAARGGRPDRSPAPKQAANGDAAVVGVPDERLGEAITAMVESKSGISLREASIIDAVNRS
jgi:acyl-CoA synthetase (AMP-forming)/AMP-acid ligase II